MRNTNYAKGGYQEIIDLNTEDSKVSVIGIHTPVTYTPRRLLNGFFNAFRQFKYLGCSVTLVPAARLPADPSQVSYDAGVNPIDPRDLLNPILFHGCHGEDLGSILNQFYDAGAGTSDIARLSTDSVEKNDISATQVGNMPVYESLYYRALTDNTWLKADPQRGFRKNGLHPMVYSLATTHQLLPTAAQTYIAQPGPTSASNTQRGVGTGKSPTYWNGAAGPGNPTNYDVGPAIMNLGYMRGLQATTDGAGVGEVAVTNPPTRSDEAFFTPRLQRLGWLDTQAVITSQTVVSGNLAGNVADANQIGNMYNLETTNSYTFMPRIFMGMILLPPAYKTEQYFRMILQHKFAFRGFRGQSMSLPTPYSGVNNVFNLYGSSGSSKGGDDDDGE